MTKLKPSQKEKEKKNPWTIIYELPIFIIVGNGQLLFSGHIDFGGIFI
jgi:hypothetical protein